MKAADTVVAVVGGTEFWAPESSQALRMADAFWRAGCEVVYVECGGPGELFRSKTARLTMNVPDVYAHPERGRFFLARAEKLPLARLSFPGLARRWHAGRVSKKLRDFLSWPERAGRRVLLAHYGWYFPELESGREWSERRLYECLDDHSQSLTVRGKPWQQGYVQKVESRLLARADLSVFSSPALLAARHALARRAELLPLGVEHEHFGRKPARDPNEAKGFGRPRVGFVGRVTGREDWKTVIQAAEMTPEWEWVVLGPLEGVTARGPEHLHWLGAVPYAELPDWMANWDAAIVPLADSEFNSASWPLKFLEYLAAGLPVASTPIPAAEKLAVGTRGLVVPAAGWGPAELVAAVRGALDVRGRARAEGPAYAAKHSWQARAERILALID